MLPISISTIHDLAHVVHSPPSPASRPQRLHLEAGFAEGLHRSRDVNSAELALPKVKNHFEARQRDGVAQRYQLGRLLGLQDTRDARHALNHPRLRLSATSESADEMEIYRI